MKKVTDFQFSLGDWPEEGVDVVVASPPYNLGTEYWSYKDCGEKTDYLNRCMCWATKVKRVLKTDGSFFLNVGASPRSPLLPHELVMRLVTLFVLQNTLHWIKSITVEPKKGPPVSVGHFKPLNSRRCFTGCHEYLFHLIDPVYFEEASNRVAAPRQGALL